ncbi:MAG: hypothetical protein V7676_13740 [Parasphingorhabdus sp.]|uniref:hypothetical protein n=1 Tax=Parasphingorhabdus sp. TaxID=2709688 RepID=UPI0030034A5B
MQLRPEIQIKTIIKAMVDVVMPTLQPDNQLAAEQSQLIVGILQLMEKQLPVQYLFDRDELTRLTETAKTLTSL